MGAIMEGWWLKGKCKGIAHAHGSIGVPVTRHVQRFLFDKNLFLGLLKSPKVREN
jgi:hypothetical protein